MSLRARVCVPFYETQVPKALIDHERPTYYWLYRHINNMYKYVVTPAFLRPTLPSSVTHWHPTHNHRTHTSYSYANRYDDEGEHVPTPPVPPGWSQQKLHVVTHDNIRVWPQTYMYGLCVIRTWARRAAGGWTQLWA